MRESKQSGSSENLHQSETESSFGQSVQPAEAGADAGAVFEVSPSSADAGESAAVPARNEYVLIPQSALYFDKPLAFDIFIRIGSKHVKVFKRGDFADKARIESYRERSDDVLYIESRELEQFMDARFGTLFEYVTSNAPMEERLKTFVRCVELCYLDMRLVRLSKDKFMRLDLIAETGFEFCKKPLVQEALVGQVCGAISGKISRRAVVGTVFAIALFSVQNDFTLATFRSLFLGSLFRDIGLPIGDGEDPHSTTTILEPATSPQFFVHPEKSVEILRDYGILDDMMQHLILEHHELPLGNGFPRGRKRAETFLPAQSLNLADWLVTLIEKCTHAKHGVQREIVLGQLQAKLPEENRRHLTLLTKIVSVALK